MRLVDTRDPRATATFREAVLQGLAPSGGLWMPEPVPLFTDWDDLLTLEWTERSTVLLTRLLGDEIDGDALAEIAGIVADAFNFPVPLVPLRPSLYCLELFHGPTLAFKDFGARFFARALDLLREPGRSVTILTATSGDTGSAVAHAFWRRPGVRVVVLYPKGKISELQERQLATLGDNVTAVAVAGTFDDCQALAKLAFADRELSARHGLTSANSINVARLLPQLLYYTEAVARLRDREVVIAVPSGNFGNLCAGLLARAMGLPVHGFLAATNANTTVPDSLDSGVYRPRPSIATLSNAMDVGAPSNWERIEHLFSHDLERIRQTLRWGWKSDRETEEIIRRLAAEGYLADPHSAVACGVLEDRLQPGETGVFLGTAHPAKFLPIYERLGIEVDVPEALASLRGKPLLSREIPNDAGAVHELLEEG
jgi:threonine synthase